MIVDEHDKIINFKKFNNLNDKDIYRVSVLWLINSKGEVLLAQRAKNKVHHPLKWGPSVAGTVEEGETYEQNIIKETEEEIGLKLNNFTKLIKTRTRGEFNHFTQWFILKIDKKLDEFEIQREEVADLKWVYSEELKKDIEKNPSCYVDSLRDIIDDKRFFKLQIK